MTQIPILRRVIVQALGNIQGRTPPVAFDSVMLTYQGECYPYGVNNYGINI